MMLPLLVIIGLLPWVMLPAALVAFLLGGWQASMAASLFVLALIATLKEIK